MSDLLNDFSQLKILIFPYFLAFVVLVLAFVYRNATFVSQNGLQIVAMAVLLPTALFAANKQFINEQAVVAILSSITGYVFASARRGDIERSK